MAKYVINDAGGTHSVDDDFDVPESWEVVDEATVRKVNPGLLGEEPADEPEETSTPESEVAA